MDYLVGSNRYKIVGKLGSGGFGETYLAQDLRIPSSRKVVVKKFNGQIGDPNAERIFMKEAQALDKLGEHECIPRLHEYFIEKNYYFLVQDYVEGHTLNYFIQNNSHSEIQVIYLLIGVLKILVFIHGKGVIHCDITPSNLILRKSDRKYVLIDFGAIKRIQSSSNKSIVVGTPGYMAPEHQHGVPNDKSDIYSLGIIGIQALTGLKPQEIPIDPKTHEFIWRDRGIASPAFIEALSRMVRYSYTERLSAEKALHLLQNIVAASNTKETKVIPPQQNQLQTYPWRYLIYLSLIVLIGLSAISSNNKVPNSEVTPPPITTPEPSPKERLSDIQGISYAKLEEFLANGNWKDAEQQTNRIILQMFGRSDGSLAEQEITQIPCRDLRTIDTLWSQYSNGHFGLRVQKEVWESFQGQRNSWERAATLLGWRDSNGEPITGEYLQYNLTNSPRGHLPHLEVLLTEPLLYHAKQCNL